MDGILTSETPMYRTHSCGELRVRDEGEPVRLSGWVRSIRDLGHLLFLDMFDAEGITQLVVTDSKARAGLRDLSSGTPLTVTGWVQLRVPGGRNPSLATGEVEVLVESFESRSGAIRPDTDSARPTVEHRLARTLSAMRARLAEQCFVEVADEELVWSSALLPGTRDRCFRIHGPRDRPLLEIAAIFVTDAEVSALTESLLRVGSAAGDAGELPEGHFPELAWNTPRSAGNPNPRWHVGPSTSDRPRTDFFVDPSLYLLAMPRELLDGAPEGKAARRPLPEFEVEARELWRGPSCVGAGAISCHDSGHLTALAEALASAPPTVRGRIAKVRRNLPDGGPPRARFVLSVADALGLRDPSTSSAMGRRADPTFVAQELDLVNASLGAVTLDSGEVERRARRAERRDLETASAVIASLGGVPMADLDGPTRLADGGTVERLLRDSLIASVHWRRLLDLFPALSETILRLPPDELYQWLWSILGNDFVRDLLADDTSYRIAREAISNELVRSHQQLVYFDRAAFADLAEALALYPGLGVARSDLVTALRRVLAEHPAAFSTLLATLVTAPEATRRTLAERLSKGSDGNLLLKAARSGLCGPTTLSLYLAASDIEHIRKLADSLADASAVLYPNRPIDPPTLAGEIAERLRKIGFASEAIGLTVSDPDRLLADLIYYLYRPTNLGIRRIHEILGELRDATGDFPRAGLRFGGPHWREEEGCFVEPSEHADRASFRLYPSKNVASFFSKASAGICTSRDAELFLREEHFHLNVVGADAPFVVGNVQIHVLQDAGDRVLLVRAINASMSWLDAERARHLVRGVLVTAVDLALHGGFTRVDLGEGMQLWHLDSGRPEIRALLDAYEDSLPLEKLQEPLLLFRFATTERILLRSYRFWPLPPELARLVDSQSMKGAPT